MLARMRQLSIHVGTALFLSLALARAFAPSPARADGPRDNIPNQVRPIPPPGVEVPESERKALESELSALAQEIDRLKANPEAVKFIPDIAIFHRAVATALHHGEFFAPEEIGKAKTLLATGRERARALAQGRRPWLAQAGPTALGYLSALDGSIQPYGLYLPETWTSASPRRWRLDTWFHGRMEKLSEVTFLESVLKSGGPFVRPDALVLQPYGRFCNGSKFAGEVDFFEALADAQRRFRVDEDRIVIRGFSLGGATVWHLAAHHAWRWAAAAPGAGFSETPEFLRAFQNETLQPSWWEQKLWQLYDAPPYAENFRQVPVVAYSGEIDKQKQAADVMAKALRATGIDLVHVIGPQTAHKYHPESKIKIDRTIDALAAKGRDPLPRRVTLVTPTLRYNRQAWIRADGLSAHWELARIEGELAGETDVRLATRNVTALTLEIPTGHAPFYPGRSPTVNIDGQRLAGPAPGSDRSWTASFRKEGARWVLGAWPEDGTLRKRPGLQGPIDDAFLTSFMMVTPSGPAMAPNISGWVHDEQMRAIREWRRHFRGEPRVKVDRDVSAEDVAAHNLILWGDPESNRLLASIAERLPVRWSKGGIAAGRDTYAPDQHALILVYPNPLNPKRYVVINSGFTFREYDYLSNARQTPKLPDWAVVDVTHKPDTRYPGKIVSADFFDERWQLRPPRKALPGPKPASRALSAGRAAAGPR
jgi:pimeloyl-ACP methyl ester carboxylesterase